MLEIAHFLFWFIVIFWLIVIIVVTPVLNVVALICVVAVAGLLISKEMQREAYYAEVWRREAAAEDRQRYAADVERQAAGHPDWIGYLHWYAAQKAARTPSPQGYEWWERECKGLGRVDGHCSLRPEPRP